MYVAIIRVLFSVYQFYRYPHILGKFSLLFAGLLHWVVRAVTNANI